MPTSTALARSPKVGDRVAIAYPAKTSSGGAVYFGQATTGEVVEGIDDDGDVLVEAVSVDPLLRYPATIPQYVSTESLTVITEEA